jgi:hypothetical protein
MSARDQIFGLKQRIGAAASFSVDQIIENMQRNLSIPSND